MSLRPAFLPLRGWIFLCMVSAPALAEGSVTPCRATLVPGASCAFRVSDTQDPSALDWRWSITAGPGKIGARTGVYKAPPVQEAVKVQVHAARDADPSVWGEASIVVLPLPFEPFDLVTQVLGHGWVEPFSRRLPFLDLETGSRMTGEAVQEGAPVRGPRIWSGHGIPFTLTWDAIPGAQALLSYWEGGEVVRRDVTGQGSLAIVPRGRIQDLRVESLLRDPGGGWSSQVQAIQVDVRGMQAFAGNPVAGPGHRDGAGISARFTEPFGVASVPNSSRTQVTFLVTDRGDHVVRTMTQAGRVSTLCGEPGKPGYRDSPTWLQRIQNVVCGKPLPPPLFHSPTYLAIRNVEERDALGFPWDAIVSDSGNHVLRLVGADGKVSTLAGRPCRPGYRDSDDPSLAAFNDPQGVAWDPFDKKLYVADRGNRVIRVVESTGRVSTLAGNPQCPGSRDGVGAQASFTDLKDLCVHLGNVDPRALYVLDGHAVRRVALPGGDVTTVLGVVDRPGWCELRPGAGGEEPDAARTPCLNNPSGLLAWTGGFFIVDHGNHALRVFAFPSTLFTKAGSPASGGRTRWGLLPDRLKAPLDETYASLDGPWTAAFGLQGMDATALVATTGPCLAEIRHAGEYVDDLFIRDAEIYRAPHEGPPVLSFTLQTLDLDRNRVRRPVYYAVDFLDSDGEIVAWTQGRAEGGDTVEATLGQALGEIEAVVIRCVTEQGWSAGGKFRVVPAEPGLAPMRTREEDDGQP